MLNTAKPFFPYFVQTETCVERGAAMRQQLCVQITSELKVTLSLSFRNRPPLGVPVFVVYYPTQKC